MKRTSLQTSDRLTVVIALLLAIASGIGLFSEAIYRDNLLVASSWRGNDLVTLFVALPILLAALLLSSRGSLRARLVLLGMLDYVLYNYAFYLFGASFNSLFLVYVALLALSIFALIFGLAGIDAKQLANRFRERTPARWISAYMFLVALFLGGFWSALSLQHVFGGQVPAMVIATGHPTNVTGALDLSLVVSINLLGAIWLWKRRPWGYVVAAIANVKGAVYMLALSSATWSAVSAGASDGAGQIILWGVIGVGCLASTVGLLANLRSGELVGQATEAE
ncbi:hypothetical protein JW848_06375 [Candidatus Bipolaricaulota bacterium]|nr:hypothetical protein [Candidatus Bipolaricaulota bacterium]